MSKTPRKKIHPYAADFAKQRQKRIRFYLLLSLGVTVIVGFSLWLGLSQTRQSPAKWQEALHPRTPAIAAQFLCSCSAICTMSLSECPCSKSGGGLEEMHFISDLLNSGVDEAQVVQRVREKYGRPRP
ncbi:hypothetical protein L0337_08120 [candidate division KSB1 bacterium]|nr:hypothetical protein [candidate division KSB1 bacterium]